MKNFTAPQRLPYTVQPLYKGHPIWWPFKRGGLSWGVKYTWFVENGAWKWTKFCNFSETFLAFPGVPLYVHLPGSVTALQWRHNGSDSVSNHQPHDCLLNRYSDADQKNIKAPRHWPLCGEFTGDQWILCTNGQLRGKCFHMMTSSWPNVSCLHQDWESEWVIKFNGLSRTADSEVHIVHISRVIIACTLKSLSFPHRDNTQSTSYK